MTPDSKTIAAGAFKARCLSLLDEVARTRTPLVVTKRGKPIARLVPMLDEPVPSLLGSVRYATEGALLAPVEADWDAEK